MLEKRYFENWLERFPDTKTLASAEESEILKAWEGLGYYNRARNLQKAARQIEDNHNGTFPTDYDDILNLPGVGQYTAGAVSSFAFGKSAPIVDGNVIRVFARIFSYREPVDTTAAKKLFWKWASDLTPSEGAREYNSAIMELGQQVCLKGLPACLLCPVSQWCSSYGGGDPETLPVSSRKTKITEKTEWVTLSRDSNGRIFLEQEQGSRRTGLWRLPQVKSPKGRKELLRLKYGITRYRVNLIVLEENNPKQDVQAFPLDTDSLPPMGAPYLKALKMMNLL